MSFQNNKIQVLLKSIKGLFCGSLFGLLAACAPTEKLAVEGPQSKLIIKHSYKTEKFSEVQILKKTVCDAKSLPILGRIEPEIIALPSRKYYENADPATLPKFVLFGDVKERVTEYTVPAGANIYRYSSTTYSGTAKKTYSGFFLLNLKNGQSYYLVEKIIETPTFLWFKNENATLELEDGKNKTTIPILNMSKYQDVVCKKSERL